MTRRKRKPVTKAQMERALMRLFRLDEAVLPRVAMPVEVYAHCQRKWSAAQRPAR